MKSRVAQTGVSLIELLIALLIGSLMMLALVQVFSASRTAYQMSEGMSRVQENARFAMEFLQRDIRLAGHFGCVNDQAHWVKEEGDPVIHFGAVGLLHPLNFAVSVQGYEATGTAPGNTSTIGSPSPGWTPGLPAEIAGLNPLPGSDILVLRYLSGRGTPVTSIVSGPGAETLSFSPVNEGWIALTDDGVTAPTMFGIADCSHADVFPGVGAAGGTVTVAPSAAPTTDLVGRYTPHPSGQTVLYRANSVVYYVGRTPAPRNEPALFRARALPGGGYDTPEELVEGIESIQLLFGQDSVTNLSAQTPPVGNITSQNTAAGIVGGAGADPANAWRRVGLVQVGILARSPTRAAAGQPANPHRLVGTLLQPPADNDGRYRATYESTVALRNRLFGN